MTDLRTNRGGGRPSRLLAPLMGIALIASGCGPVSTPQGGGAVAETPSAPKTLVMAMQGDNEPDSSPAMYGRAGSGSAAQEHYFIFHANLTKYDVAGNVIAYAAQKVPTIDDGDWKVLPQGMEVTWKLRPDAFWHDGTPLTAEDFAFGFQVVKDPDLAVETLAELPNISGARAVDPHTLVITWKTQSIFGNINAHDGVPAIPRHIFQDLYLTGDKVAFENSPFWKQQWVGLGPYRLSEWVLGSHMEGAAFDRFLLGGPKIDRLIIRYIGDPNALVANILAGDIDVVPMGAQLDIGQTVTVRRAWEPIDGGVTLPIPKGVRTIYLQFRDPLASWAQDLRVRQALIHMLNREEFVEALLFGLTPRADYFLAQEDPVYRLAEQRGLPRYAYDPQRAERLLAEAGWTRGGDRIFRNSAGQPFSIDVTSSSSGDNVRENETVAGQWSVAGFQSHPTPYGRGIGGEDARRIRHTQKGALIWPWNFAITAVDNVTARQIGSQSNRWQGSNYGGYLNPAYEDIYTRLSNELKATERQELLFRLMKILAEDLPVLPIFYTTLSLVARKGVEGPGMVAPVQPANTWNIHTWELKGR